MSLKINGTKTVMDSPTGFFQLPAGTTAQRPTIPAAGMIRYNNDNNRVEVYAADTWRPIASTVSLVASTIDPGTNVIYSWGSNLYGESLLPPTLNLITTPTLSSETFKYKKIVTSIGGDSTFIIASNGTLWAVGNNNYGQLGLGDTDSRSVLTKVGTDTWKDISCYGNHAAGIKSDGTLWSWGNNDHGQLAQGNVTNYIAPSQVGTLTSWSSVACGETHTIAVQLDGSLWGAGNNVFGQLGTGNTTQSTLMVKTSSTLTSAWGAVLCGQNSSYAFNSDTYLYSWGDNSSGQLGLGTTNAIYADPTRISTLAAISYGAVSVGRNHVLAINSSNQLYMWGDNASGQLSTGSTSSLTSPTRYGTGTAWWQCSAGDNYSLALTSDGTMYGCGANDKAQLGLGDTTNRLVFEQTSSILWGSVFAGNNNSIATKSVATTDYGGIKFTSPVNTYIYWTVPAGVDSICVAAIGGGASGGYQVGGGGGGAAYANSIAVTPGQQIRILVGQGGGTSAGSTGVSGTASSLDINVNGTYLNILTCYGGTKSGGPGGGYSFNNTDYILGTYQGFNGGSGGIGGGGSGRGGGYVGSAAGGGGRSSSGGTGWPQYISSGSYTYGGSGGGGGSLGQGLLGSNGSSGNGNDGGNGGSYGGGGGGVGGFTTTTPGAGKNGAIRIIWGAGRSFPTFQTQKLGTEV